jgi:predicted AlkP superfamily phosphohydrolase/phosphomutase
MIQRFAYLTAAVALLCGSWSCGRSSGSQTSKRMIVLGIDGMDPVFLERHWDVLPNLSRLRGAGEFKRLRTSIPPQSPVAWSTFITGMDPGGHGIFDFVHRNPKTLAPFSSMAETIEPRWNLPLGPYELPLSRGKVRLLRRGTAFWQPLAASGVPVTVIRMPNNFPPVDCEGLSLAGMGTPDLRGTFGTFTFFSDEPGEETRDVSGGKIVGISLDRGAATLRVEGPVNTLRRDRSRSFIEVKVDVDPDQPVARFRVDDSVVLLREKEWSNWIHVKFPLMGSFAGVNGMVRIYVKQLHPDLKVYVSPVNIDPEDPEAPISTPTSYSRELAKSVGPYYTQGIAEDTSALRQGVLNRAEFLQQANLVADEHLALLRHSVENFRSGLLFFHFFGVDQVSHTFWGKYEPEVLGMYRRVDREIGWVMEHAGDATLVVMSDHGFTTFDRAVHLNTWLLREGFLTLQDPSADVVGADLGGVDWSRTQAYAMGLNGLYLNQAGREAHGIVPVSQRNRLLASLRERLLAAQDPTNGAPAIGAVYAPQEIFLHDALADAPDLIVGYSPGYRASWQTALGGIPPQLMEDNTDEWIADHCVMADRVPGVFLSNRKTRMGSPNLQDLTVSILGYFGLKPLPGMSGTPIF